MHLPKRGAPPEMQQLQQKDTLMIMGIFSTLSNTPAQGACSCSCGNRSDDYKAGYNQGLLENS
jgi:hypothetical protein